MSALIYLWLIFVPFSSCANILAFVPTPSYSHQIAFTQLWKELSLRGHKVTSVTTDPINDPNLINLTEISMRQLYENRRALSKIAENKATTWNTPELLLTMGLKTSEQHFSHQQIQKLIHGQHRFDLVLVTVFYPEFLIFGKIYGCPTILINSFDLPITFYHLMGNPAHPVTHPDKILPFHRTQNFKERLLSTLYCFYIWFWNMYEEYPKRQRLIDKYFNTSVSMEELLKNVDMVFVNTHSPIHGARALGPTTITIGYERKAISAKPLQKDLKDFMDYAQDGFIYFSLGSNVKSKDLDKKLLETIMQSLKQVPYKILYKYEADDLPDKPDNIMLIKWAPQGDILRHPNIKLFVTQGGSQSMEEAIHSAVPMVVIPFYLDQENNAKLMESKGIAKTVGRKPLKKEEFINAIFEVINNPSYKEAITRLRQLALDVPMTGLEKAIWWTEYVIRHKGAKHLRNPVADLPSYQYYLLDVIGFFILIFVASCTVAYVVLRKIVRKIALRLRPTANKKLQ